MSDKNSLLRAFNSHFFDFLNDIISILPDNLEIATAKTSFELIKRANPTVIVKAWYTYVYFPYIDTINAGNIQFFFEKDYGGDLKYMVNSNEIMNIIDKIRGPIKSMNETNQAHSVKYIQNLSKISNLYNELNK